MKAHVKGTDKEGFVHPLSKWRLWSKFENGKIVGGGIDSVRIFLMLAGFILLIACINSILTLSTARSVKRGKEVGILKVVGAGRFSIALRFSGRMSRSRSHLRDPLSCHRPDQYQRIQLRLPEIICYVPYGNPWFWLGILGFAIFTGLIAGSYPAFYLSTFRPISVLKGTFKTIVQFGQRP